MTTGKDEEPCMACGTTTPIHLLDAKPSAGKWTVERLARAADAGVNFERLECADCFGPGYQPGESP